MTSIPVAICRNSPNKFKRNYLKKDSLFLDFLLLSWNVHGIWNILKKKDEYPSRIICQLFESERGGYLNVRNILLQNTMR